MRIRLALLSAALLFACGPRNIRPTTDEKVQLTPERIERGRYVAEHVASCGACHTTRDTGVLEDAENPDKAEGGGNWMRDDGMGIAIWIPNITNDPETGIGKWSDDELIRAIRDGIAPDKHVLLPLMPYSAYKHMSDEDVRAVVAYLRSLPPQKTLHPRPDNKVPFFINWLTAWGTFSSDPAVNVAEPDPSNRVEHGEYLVRMGHCDECHSMGSFGPRKPDDALYMAGSSTSFNTPGYGKVWARNLTPDQETGVGRYSDEQLVSAILGGHRLDGKKWAPPMGLFAAHTAGLQLSDAEAIVAYLRSLKPAKNQVHERELTAEGRKKLGDE